MFAKDFLWKHLENRSRLQSFWEEFFTLLPEVGLADTFHHKKKKKDKSVMAFFNKMRFLLLLWQNYSFPLFDMQVLRVASDCIWRS